MNATASEAVTATSDQGLFGPDSVSWRVIESPAALIGGLRALILQSLHPLAMAGVAQHSDYAERGVLRLQRTTEYVATVTFGSTAEAIDAAERVRKVHERVRGVDPVTGRRYEANDPENLLWVHCVEVHSFLVAYRAYHGSLSGSEQDRYLAEQVGAAELVGVPAELVPADRASYRAYFERMRSQLCVSEAAREAIRFVVSPPLSAEMWKLQVPLRLIAPAAIALVPRDLQRLAGIEQPGPVEAAAATTARALVATLRLPGLRELPGVVVGGRTVRIIRSAQRG